MRLGKAVIGEALEHMEELLGGVAIDAVVNHAVDELCMHRFHALARALMPHCAAELIGLAGREAGRLDRQSHSLLLKERHAERAFQHRFEFGVRIRNRLEPRTPAQKRMDHLALNRPRPNDRNLHDDVVKTGRL